MYDYLVDHAIKNVWCTPDQDLQAVVKPARITPQVGVFNKVDVLWRTHDLPVKGARFHVYQIGQLHPLLMGLFPVQRQWVTMAETCNLMHLVVDIYNNAGVQLPRCQVWYRVTSDRNLILAVKAQERVLLDLQTEDIFVRVYTNAYFNSLRADAATDVVHVEGGEMRDNNDVIALQTNYLAWKAKPGLTSAYVNGYLVPEINLINVVAGDMAEFVYDSSVKRVVNFNVGELDTFQSTLDAKRKYLLHYAGNPDDTIDFHDDLDLFVIKPGVNNLYKGVYFHRNQGDAVRMVTHKDYAIPTPYIQGYADTNAWGDPLALTVRVVIRKAGYLRPLVNEHNRIKELYKLDDAVFRRALMGLDSVLENWTAAWLENSFYTKMMGAHIDEMTGDLTEKAYGYNAISKLLADTPEFTRVFSNQKIVDVPYGLQSRSTGYEYNAAGYLLGWFTHIQGSVYAARDTTSKYVEMFSGDAGDRLDETYGERIVILDPNANYRMYRCPLQFGVPTNVWEDVTGSSQYTIVNNRLTWLIPQTEWYTMVRSDRTMLGYTLNLSAADGLLRFTLTSRQLRNNTVSTWPMQVPMGELDIFLNGKSLIEGLDYVVQYPQVVVTNKEYLVNPRTQLQRIDIRHSGFCKADLTREELEDVGFVQYGQLSHNNRFDIRDDKVMRIVVDGALYDRSELTFTEDNPAVQVLDARNGSPYLIRDIIVPMRGYTDENTYSLRAKSKAVDKKVADYMTLKYPQPETQLPNVVAPLYAITSPFVNKIMRDLQTGVLNDPRLKEHYSEQVVRELCAPYEWILAFDPTQAANAPDPLFVNIHPHNQAGVVDIDVYHYKFLSRVVKIYTQDKVSLSHFLRLLTP